MSEESEFGKVRKLPLVKAWLEENDSRLKYGSEFKTSELEEFFGHKRETVHFAACRNAIRKALRARGMNFTDRGMNGSVFIIPHPSKNVSEMKRMKNVAANAEREGVKLGAATPLELLTAKEREEHALVFERLSALHQFRRREARLKSRRPQLDDTPPPKELPDSPQA